MERRKRQGTKGRLLGGIPVRIILPVSLTVILFGMTIFLLLLPLIEEKLMDGKREMIRELTESSWSILVAHAQEEKDGLVTRQKAQASAIENLRRLRYGPREKKGQIFEIDKIKTKLKPKLVPSLAYIAAPSARAGRV